MRQQEFVRLLGDAKEKIVTNTKYATDLDLKEAENVVSVAIDSANAEWLPQNAKEIQKMLSIFATRRLEPRYEEIADLMFEAAHIIRTELSAKGA